MTDPQSTVTVPDTTLEEAFTIAFVGSSLIFAAYLVLGLVTGKSPLSWTSAPFLTVCVTPLVGLLLLWVVAAVKRRKFAFRLSDDGLERLEEGHILWRIAWPNLQLMLNRRLGPYDFARVVFDISDTEGRPLGRLGLPQGRSRRSDYEMKEALATALRRAARVEVPVDPTQVRRRRSLIRGSVASLLGVGLTALCVVGISRFMTAVAQEEPAPDARTQVLLLFPALTVALMGLVELTHAYRKDVVSEMWIRQLSSLAEGLRPLRIEMAAGVWYQYRDRIRIAAEASKFANVVTYLIGGLLVLFALVAFVSPNSVELRRDPMGALLAFAVPGGCVLLLRTSALAWGAPALHEFLLEGDHLIVRTPKGLRTYPATPVKRWNGGPRSRGFRDACDTYGRFPRFYWLDPCWIEPVPTHDINREAMPD